jgi:hypothetical protein
MAAFKSALAAALLTPVAAGIIAPSLDALAWKFDDADFWAPVHLRSNVYHAQSPAGVEPDSLTRRALPEGGHIGCTVVTIDGPVDALSRDVVEKAMRGYEADDVWSAEQFMGCLFVQYDGEGGVAVDPAFAEFLAEKEVETLYVGTGFDMTGFAAAVNVFSVESKCELSNGPYVATLPKCDESGLSMAPVYALHSDNYDGMSVQERPFDRAKPKVITDQLQPSCTARSQTATWLVSTSRCTSRCPDPECPTSLCHQSSRRQRPAQALWQAFATP